MPENLGRIALGVERRELAHRHRTAGVGGLPIGRKDFITDALELAAVAEFLPGEGDGGAVAEDTNLLVKLRLRAESAFADVLPESGKLNGGVGLIGVVRVDDQRSHVDIATT